LTKLSEFVSAHRARFTIEHDNMFGFSWAKVSRHCGFMEIIERRYEAASAAYIANSEAVRKAMPTGVAPVSPELEAIMNETWPLQLDLDLQQESAYIFAKIILDDVARAIQLYFGPHRDISLNSHDRWAKAVREYAAAKALAVSEEFVDSVTRLKERVCDFRDKQIEHENCPRTTHATAWDQGGSHARMVKTRLYPTENDPGQAEAETPVQLRAAIEAYLDQVVEFLLANEAKTNLKTAAAA
jgi:hypothetical protein